MLITFCLNCVADMNSSEGLVKRKTAATASAAAADETNCKGREPDDSAEDYDDKETRLTLMEEVLLLGLKDREVCLFKF